MTKALVLWFTGLSGAGKTTIALGARERLEGDGWRVAVVDGDAVRAQRHSHLGFSEADIRANNALIAGLCADMTGDFDVILVPIISPFAASREAARAKLGDRFYEVHVAADLDTVIARDVKGLYSKARRNEITNLIGFSPGAAYEAPPAPDLTIDTASQPPAASVALLCDFIGAELREAGRRATANQ